MMLRSGPIVALRERDTVALGSLQERGYVTGDLLVTSRDLAGESWWVPAESVWVDADAIGHPEHPRATGLATAINRDQAVLTGLSDRLGWEAVLEFERGTDLPPALAVAEAVPDHVVVLDGRLGHDVPTVVVMGPDFVRWGAGSTWDGAVRRALYGDAGNPSVSAELRHVTSVLGSRGLGVVAVDLDTPLLAAFGHRALQRATGRVERLGTFVVRGPG